MPWCLRYQGISSYSVDHTYSNAHTIYIHIYIYNVLHDFPYIDPVAMLAAFKACANGIVSMDWKLGWQPQQEETAELDQRSW